MVMLEFSMFPTDKGESVSEYVSQIIQFIDKSGVLYKLTPMGTILEGDWDEIMSVVTGCFKLLEKQSNRISMSLKVDYRKGKDTRMEYKVKAIENKLGVNLNR